MELGAFSVSLAVKDIEASKAFYEKLGFTEFGGDVAQNWLILKNGDHVIGLFQGMFEKNILTFNPGWDQNAQKLDTFTDVRELQRQLKAQGVAASMPEADETHDGPGQLHRSWTPTATRSSSTSTSDPTADTKRIADAALDPTHPLIIRLSALRSAG